MGITAAVFAGVTAISAYENYAQQRKAAGAQKDVIKGQQAMQDLETRRARLESRRQARAARAAVLSAGEAAGVAPTSSAVQGGVASTTMKDVANQDFLTGMGVWQNYTLSKRQDVVDAETKGNMWNAVGSLSNIGFSATKKG
jgi:hypothetical protein